jgi:hypothetical protein
MFLTPSQTGSFTEETCVAVPDKYLLIRGCDKQWKEWSRADAKHGLIICCMSSFARQCLLVSLRRSTLFYQQLHAERQQKQSVRNVESLCDGGGIFYTHYRNIEHVH